MVTGAALAWTIHGYPDFPFRSGEWVFISALARSIGGALFGVPNAATVGDFARGLDYSIRPS